jgi:L-arabinose isomerase
MRPRIGVLAPYWDFWEHTLEVGARQSLLANANQVANALAGEFEVSFVAQLARPEEAATLTRQVGAVGPDAVLVLAAMAVPPRTVTSFLDTFPGVEVVVWAVHEPEFAVGPEFDHRAVTRHGATVGAPMLGSALRLGGRQPVVLLGRLGDPLVLEHCKQSLRAAAAASRLRCARVGTVGPPLGGYDHVVTEPAALKRAVGVTLVAIEAAEFRDTYLSAPEELVEEVKKEVTRGFTVDLPKRRGEEAFSRMARAAVALEELCGRHRLDAGAMNCHVPEIRLGSEVGIAPCFALGRLASAGVPWTCTGDVLTAVAMCLVAKLGGATLYNELEAFDYTTGEFVVANSGEHDVRWWDGGVRPRLACKPWFHGIGEQDSLCVSGPVLPSKATLVSFSEGRPGVYRVITASGEITGKSFPRTGTTNGALRLGAPDPVAAWERWCSAGAGHHSCLAKGDISSETSQVARFLQIEFCSIC